MKKKKPINLQIYIQTQKTNLEKRKITVKVNANLQYVFINDFK